ncbi:uncharacterized protein LOC144100532 [Amblyomma americanum]
MMQRTAQPPSLLLRSCVLFLSLRRRTSDQRAVPPASVAAIRTTAVIQLYATVRFARHRGPLTREDGGYRKQAAEASWSMPFRKNCPARGERDVWRPSTGTEPAAESCTPADYGATGRHARPEESSRGAQELHH